MRRYQRLLFTLFALILLSSCATSTPPPTTGTPTQQATLTTPTSSPNTPTPHAGTPTPHSGSPTPTPSVTLQTPTVPPPTPTPVPSPPTTHTASQRAVDFYQAIRARHYAEAASYLAANAYGPDGKKLDQATLTQLAQSRDSDIGPITSITVSGTLSPSEVVMSIVRSDGVPYHSHLRFQAVENDWKLLTFDRL